MLCRDLRSFNTDKPKSFKLHYMKYFLKRLILIRTGPYFLNTNSNFQHILSLINAARDINKLSRSFAIKMFHLSYIRRKRNELPVRLTLEFDLVERIN